MNKRKQYISLKTRIMFSTLVPVVLGISIISFVIFVSLFNSVHGTAKAELSQVCNKYAVNFEKKINIALDYLSVAVSTLEFRLAMGLTDREMARDTIFNTFDAFGDIDGSSVYFEPNMYDGRDAEYIKTEYGTEKSGRICYYFYKDGEKTLYVPEAIGDDIEFELPHYTMAKEANAPIYTDPVVYEVEGKNIPMFTITYPVRNPEGKFIGAVTVDLFLEDLYTQLQEEKIYQSGYISIANDKDSVIYSPIFEDIGKNRGEAGFNYALSSDTEAPVFTNSKSILTGKDNLVAIKTIFLPQLNSFFYVSASAPLAEINAGGLRLMAELIVFCLFIVSVIALLLYYLIGKISAPIKEITQSADRIANGTDSTLVYNEKNAGTTEEIYTLTESVKKMLAQLNEGEKLKLTALELKHEKEKAEAAAKAKNEFLAKMSHEIRTPMNAVVGMTELILRKDLPQDVYEDASVIKSSSANLLAIINDILDFSKIESGMLEITEAEYLLPSLINDVINVIRIRLVDKPVLFAVNIDPHVPATLTGDEVRIRQILINLLSNAVKYTNEGNISLTLTKAEGDKTGGDDNIVRLVFKISDSGVGIREEDIGKLFGNFVQVDAVKNKGVEGTGLGLAISRSLSQMMGGDITVASEYGKGSVFTVTLPQKCENYKPFADIPESEDKSVLLYETRDAYRDSLEASLESLGIDYKIVRNIPALFEDLGEFPFVFISSFMYDSVYPALSKLPKPPKLILLSDITDNKAPKNARVLTMPAHSLSIANMLCDVYEDYGKAAVTGASFLAPEAKILLVDDIAANLRVGEGLLLPYEMQITLCSNGKEALELVAENYYDLVFMDHMMPEMDGLEAAGLIRKMDGEYFKNLPIIALTANAVSGVREMYIQNGMNDFLAKPIETAKLNSILEKWIPAEKKRKNTISANEEKESEFVENLRSLPELSVDKALGVLGGSVQSYERIVRLSIRLLPENIERLCRLIDTDLPNYAIEVHGIKSVLNNIGAYEFGMTALRLEELSKDGELEECKPIHAEFIEKLNSFSIKVNALTQKEEKADKLQGDKVQLLQALVKTEEKIDFYDSAASLHILNPLCEYSYGETADTLLGELLGKLERFDFDEALETLDKLKEMLALNNQ